MTICSAHASADTNVDFPAPAGPCRKKDSGEDGDGSNPARCEEHNSKVRTGRRVVCA